MNEQFNNNVNEVTENEQTPAVDVQQEAKVCSNCQSPLASGQKFCPNCGAVVEEAPAVPQVVTCGACGAEVAADTKFCPNCGKQVEQPKAPAEEQNKKKLMLIGGIVAAAVLVVAIVILCIALRKVPVESIALSGSSVELKVEETVNISCTVYPDNASDKTVSWSSSDTSVATVNSYGLITAVGKGTCVITAQVGDQSKSVTVTVRNKVDFQKIYDEYCNSIWATLGSDKSYLSVDSNPYDYDDGDYRYTFTVNDAIKKINKALGLPDSLYEDMGQTSWSMGKQNETFESVGVTVSWTYHPDKGLEVTYKLINN